MNFLRLSPPHVYGPARELVGYAGEADEWRTRHRDVLLHDWSTLLFFEAMTILVGCGVVNVWQSLEPSPGAETLSLLLSWLRDTPAQTLFLTAVAFAVSAIPTELPAVVTTILAAGTTTLAPGPMPSAASPRGRR